MPTCVDPRPQEPWNSGSNNESLKIKRPHLELTGSPASLSTGFPFFVFSAAPKDTLPRPLEVCWWVSQPERLSSSNHHTDPTLNNRPTAHGRCTLTRQLLRCTGSDTVSSLKSWQQGMTPKHNWGQRARTHSFPWSQQTQLCTCSLNAFKNRCS